MADNLNSNGTVPPYSHLAKELEGFPSFVHYYMPLASLRFTSSISREGFKNQTKLHTFYLFSCFPFMALEQMMKDILKWIFKRIGWWNLALWLASRGCVHASTRRLCAHWTAADTSRTEPVWRHSASASEKVKVTHTGQRSRGHTGRGDKIPGLDGEVGFPNSNNCSKWDDRLTSIANLWLRNNPLIWPITKRMVE